MKDIDKKWLEKWETVKEKTGKIYSEEYRQRFETKNVIFKIERSPIDKNKLMLTRMVQGTMGEVTAASA